MPHSSSNLADNTEEADNTLEKTSATVETNTRDSATQQNANSNQTTPAVDDGGGIIVFSDTLYSPCRCCSRNAGIST